MILDLYHMDHMVYDRESLFTIPLIPLICILQALTTRKPLASTTASPLIKPIIPGCVPLFDAYPLPSIPPEITNLTKVLNAEVDNLYKLQKFKVNV